ncbi:hypothetical protein B0H21DRAFT_728077 [Amylocystis lapponica]|nr:hypothetical protein B0H21DRAFT_728077 [Amylocystis lapponica]
MARANYSEIATDHVEFDWSVDFASNIISGSATLTLTAKRATLDTNNLTIDKVLVGGHAVSYDLGPNIRQTQGKTFPYLFSQCQPIYARSLAPLQDTPAVKITYSAKVTSVLPVLLSAIRISPPSDGPAHDGKTIGKDAVAYTYTQPVPIPSYLIAIAAGNVRYHPCPSIAGKQWKSGVWAEPELIDAAYWEFSEAIGRFLSTAETILPPYRFGVYDVLVLPPSFPYGGMENACLTFLTPTLLVGDRTLVDVVVHELTHSWFGNGVTQAHSSHFWLNEGWTTYIERVLQQLLHSPEERWFSFLIGAKSLSDALKLYEDHPKYQRLLIDFEKGEDPDDAYSTIPYEKGANFLLHLERKLGGLDVFLQYAFDYVSTFMGKSITTEEWKAHLYGYFEKHGGAEKIKALDSVDWNAWLYGEGVTLPVEMEYDLTLAQQAYALAEKWDAARSVADISQLKFKETDLDGFNSNQKAVFLERLEAYPALPSAHIELMGTLYRFTDTTNPEVRLRYYEIALAGPSSSIAKALAPEAVKWVVGQDATGLVKGRMKFCRPIFRAVYKVDKPLAVTTFMASKDAFHPIARRLIEKDLGLV